MTATVLRLPLPDQLPASRAEVTAALRRAGVSGRVLPDLAAPASRGALLRRLGRLAGAAPDAGPSPTPAPPRLPPPASGAEAEQQEHDRYFSVSRVADEPGVSFIAGTALAYLRAYENCLDMGVTLLSQSDWEALFGGWTALVGLVDTPHAGRPVSPPLPQPDGWRGGYDPAARWLIGHQLFFALIQGAIVGLNCFVGAVTAAPAGEPGDAVGATAGLALAAAFLRSSAAAMRFASDFAVADYEATVRPAMAPPAVRPGFSGLQTRDHTYLVRVFGALKPILAGDRRGPRGVRRVGDRGLRSARVHLHPLPRRRAAEPADGCHKPR
jgi:hypothetical protein